MDISIYSIAHFQLHYTLLLPSLGLKLYGSNFILGLYKNETCVVFTEEERNSEKRWKIMSTFDKCENDAYTVRRMLVDEGVDMRKNPQCEDMIDILAVLYSNYM